MQKATLRLVLGITTMITIPGYLVVAYWYRMFPGQTDTGTVQEDEKSLLLIMSHVQSNPALRTPLNTDSSFFITDSLLCPWNSKPDT